MSFPVTMDTYPAGDRHYHVTRLTRSLVGEQLHYHKHFQLCFVSRGEILHSQENELVHLTRGDAFIVPPGFSHRINFVSDSALIYCLSFEERLFRGEHSQDGIGQFLSDLRLHARTGEGEQVKLRIALNNVQRSGVQALMDCLLREQENHDASQLSAASCLVASVICYLAQNYYQQPQNRDRFRTVSGHSAALSLCAEYIDRHFDQPITRELLARQSAMSVSSFGSQFPQYTGLSLKQYVTRRRILEAEALIRSRPELSMNEIAQRVGYKEFSTFYRNFTRITGIAPSKYKKICGQEPPRKE